MPDGDDSRRAIAEPPNPRAALLTSLAEHLPVLAHVGDIEAVRVASDAIGRLLGLSATGSCVVDLAVARRKRPG